MLLLFIVSATAVVTSVSLASIFILVAALTSAPIRLLHPAFIVLSLFLFMHFWWLLLLLMLPLLLLNRRLRWLLLMLLNSRPLSMFLDCRSTLLVLR